MPNTPAPPAADETAGVVVKICEHCTGEFDDDERRPGRPRRFCSDLCRKGAWDAKDRAERRRARWRSPVAAPGARSSPP